MEKIFSIEISLLVFSLFSHFFFFFFFSHAQKTNNKNNNQKKVYQALLCTAHFRRFPSYQKNAGTPSFFFFSFLPFYWSLKYYFFVSFLVEYLSHFESFFLVVSLTIRMMMVMITIIFFFSSFVNLELSGLLKTDKQK